MWLIHLILVLVSLDLGIKSSIESQDASEFPRELPGSRGKVFLHKNHNAGFSFGCLESHPGVVKMVPLAVASFTGGILACLLSEKGKNAEKFGLSLVLAGAISNLYDRFCRNYVVDYFSFSFGKLKKVVFNLGDLFIFLGTAIVFLAQVARKGRERE